MTQRQTPDLDLVLGVFLSEGPEEAPDRAIDGALDAIAATGQIRRPLAGGTFVMPARARLAVAAALVLVALAATAIFVGRERPTPTPAPSASANVAVESSSPSPSGEGFPPLATPAPLTPQFALIHAAVQEVD